MAKEKYIIEFTWGENNTLHEEMEIEVTGTDDVNRKYQIMILTPKELFGKTVSVSSKYMERGPWTKTETPDVFESRIARVTLIFD